MSKITELLKSYSDLPEFLERELVDVNQRGNFGNTPLHVAAVRGDFEAVQELIKAGADPNAAGELGNAPLHDAIVGENPEVVAALINCGGDPERRNDHGLTPREVAVMTKRTKLIQIFDALYKGNSEE